MKGHGWMGIRFQKHVGSKPNECIIHVKLNDQNTEWQQQVLGMIGINLVFACYYYSTPEKIIDTLADNIRQDRFEIDVFTITGPDFHSVDNRLLTLKLVKTGLSQVAMFGSDKNVILPSDTLYKKNTLVLRGRFRPVTHVNVDMMIKGYKDFKKLIDDTSNILPVVEITLADLSSDGDFDEQDYLDRVDLLCTLGQTVMISNYQEHYKLTNYLSQFIKDKTLGIIVGMNNLARIFDKKYYKSLKGGILESFSLLFASNVKLLVYPSIDKNGDVKYANDYTPERYLLNLYNFFIENKKIIEISNAKIENLDIISDQVVQMIEKGDMKWESMVPNKVSTYIKKHHLFNLPYDIPLDQDH